MDKSETKENDRTRSCPIMTKRYKRVISVIVGMGLIGTVGLSDIWKTTLVAGMIVRPRLVIAQQNVTPLQLEFDLYLAKLSDVSRWQFYLYNRTVEEGLSSQDFLKLKKLGYCESNWRQFDQKGKVLAGQVHSPDSGIFQINKTVWQETADLLEYNLDTPEGNIDFAIMLYKEYGTKPWICKV